MQDPNNPGDDEFLDNEFEAFDEFDEADMSFAADEAGDDLSAGIGGDDDSFLNEGWEEFDEQEAVTSGGRKKSGGLGLSFNTIVIGIAVVVGLFVLGYQVMSSGSGGGTSRFQSALDFTGSTDGPVLGETEQDQPVMSAQPVERLNDDGGFLSNPALLDDLEREAADITDAPPMPSPFSNETDEQGMAQHTTDPNLLTPMPEFAFAEAQQVPRAPDATATQTEDVRADESSPALDVIRRAQNQQQAATQAEPAIVDAPIIDDATSGGEIVPDVAQSPEPEPVSVPPSAVAESAPAQTPPAPLAETSGTADQAALMAKLDQLADRLGVMEQQIVQIRESGQSNIDSLEKEVASLRSGLRDAGATRAPSQSAVSTTQAPKKETTPAKPAAPKPAVKAPVATTSSRAAPSAPVASNAAWELRAAQPGRAWVSRRGDREMQSVSPGDTLSGIGRVQSIDYANGRWVVVGTQGQIRQ